MKNYIVYLSNGKIERVGICPDEDLRLQGDLVIEGTADDAVNYIENEAVVAMPPKPSDSHIFDYTLKQWIDPRTPATQWPIVRAQRDRLLQQSDWTQLPDIPLATKEAWAVYRQALRDVTNQPDPFNIVWPMPPN